MGYRKLKPQNLESEIFYSDLKRAPLKLVRPKNFTQIAGDGDLEMENQFKNRLLVGFLKKFVSCKRAAWLMSQSLDSQLKVRERMALGAHLRLCPHCMQLKKHFEIMRNISRLSEEDIFNCCESDQPVSLSSEARNRIQRIMSDRLNAAESEQNVRH